MEFVSGVVGMELSDKDIKNIQEKVQYEYNHSISYIRINDFNLVYKENSKSLFVDSNYVIFADIRWDNYNNFIENIDAVTNEDSVNNYAQNILLSFQKFGSEFIHHVSGDFIIIIYNIKEKELYIFRDHIGVRTLYYSTGKNKLYFSSLFKGLDFIGGIPSWELNIDWLQRFLINVYPEMDTTAYKCVSKLKPACFFKYSNNTIEFSQYWNPIGEDILKSEDDILSDFKRKLVDAVQSCCHKGGKIACDLSGGLDSSGIAVLADKYLKESGGELFPFSRVWDDKIKDFPAITDEREFYNVVYEKVEKKVNPYTHPNDGYVSMIEDVINNFGGLYMMSSGGHNYPSFINMQRQGISHVLTGFGGDQGPSNMSQNWFVQLSSEGKWSVIFDILKQENKGRLSVTKYWVRYLIIRYFKFLQGAVVKDKQHAFISDVLLVNSYIINNNLDALIKKLIFPNSESTKQFLFHNITSGYIENRLEDYAAYSCKFEIDHCHPLLNKELLTFSYNIRPEYNLRKGTNRYLFRESLKGILPDKVRMRTKGHYSMLPNLSYWIYNDRIRIRALINNCNNKIVNGIIDIERMNKWFDLFIATYSKGKVLEYMSFMRNLQILIFADLIERGELKGEF